MGRPRIRRGRPSKIVKYALIILSIVLSIVGMGVFLYFRNLLPSWLIPNVFKSSKKSSIEPEEESIITRVYNKVVEYVTLERKIGVCMSPKLTKCGDFDLLTSSAWYCNWGMKASKCPVKPNAEFVPMIYKYHPNVEYTFDMIEPGTKYLMSFNEPNHIHQANVTPAHAVEGWLKMQAVWGDTHELISASPHGCGKPEKCIPGYQHTTDWFDEFFRLADEHYKKTGVELRVDYIAIHLYKNSVGAAKEYIESLRKYGKKIWVTEVGTFSGNPEKQLSVMKELIPYLEGENLVYRYAWFVNRSDSETPWALIDENDKLTPLGKQYNTY